MIAEQISSRIVFVDGLPRSARDLGDSGFTYATKSNFRIAKDVSLLWTHHTKVDDELPRAWKTARSAGKVGQKVRTGRSCTIIVRNAQVNKRRSNMLWTIFVVVVVLWLLGFSLHIAGGLIHILLAVALVILVINLLSGRRIA